MTTQHKKAADGKQGIVRVNKKKKKTREQAKKDEYGKAAQRGNWGCSVGHLFKNRGPWGRAATSREQAGGWKREPTSEETKATRRN